MLLFDGEVLLRPFKEEDIENKIKWINDEKNNRYLHYDIPLEYDKTLEWFRNKRNDVRCDLVVEYQGVPVGLIGLIAVDRFNCKAEYYICMGEQAFKGKGIATRATKLLLGYSFDTLKMNKVYLNVDEENEIACRLYEKVGFVCEGIFKEDLFHRGKFINRKRYSAFSKTWGKEINK